jgi:serine/threonine-protein kinase RsbW
MTLSRAVENDLSDVGYAVEWAGWLASNAGLPEDVRFNIEVCLEEALANLILHGQADDDGKEIAVAFSADATGASILITDRCAPFDVEHEAPPPRGGLEDPQEGGRGLRLLRAFASELAYASKDGENALTLMFRAPPPGDAPTS